MCLIALALDAHPRHTLVVAANRDEWHERPAAGLDWWRDEASPHGLLAGRDLIAGGTWMGLADQGRIGLLTNVRDPSRQRAAAASRGRLVSGWLSSDREWHAPHDVNPFNFVGGDLRTGRWWWASDSQPKPLALTRGVHGLSNGAFTLPWPKARRLCEDLAGWLAHDARDFAPLFTALRNEAPFTGEDSQGDGPEAAFSGVFIRHPMYGTRCSTVVAVSSKGEGTIIERRFSPEGEAAGETEIAFAWPN